MPELTKVTDWYRVPGKWLDACGLGTEDRTFRVKCVEPLLNGFHAVHVIVDGEHPYKWLVIHELRDGQFVDGP